MLGPKFAAAQIVTDGTMGAGKSLTGPNFQIGSDLGKLYGKNLFHSFKEFNLANGESANFSGPASVRNILSRVTGGNPSSIDGSINSSIAGANLFFINPAGVVFGAHAQVNVSGSFVASTADVLKLADGSTFSAVNPGNAVLSSASPVAFGFLGSNPAPIVLNGTKLKLGTGRTLSLVGGDVQLNGAEIEIDKGKVNLVGVGSPGEVGFDATNAASQPVLSGFSSLGNVALDNASIDASDDVSNSGPGPGGSVTVRGDSFGMDNESSITAINRGQTDGGLIDIDIKGTVDLRNDSSIVASAFGSGRGASINLRAGDVAMTGVGFPNGSRFTGLRATAGDFAKGNAGSISVETGKLVLLDGARISGNTESRGRGGDVTIRARDILLDGGNSVLFTGIAAQSLRQGQGGNIEIGTGTLTILGGAEVSTSAVGSGNGGGIHIVADKLVIDGRGTDFFTGLAASTSNFSGAHGGNIKLDLGSLRMMNSGGISVDTRGSGVGGNVLVNAKDIELTNKAVISAEVDGIAPGGTIELHADHIKFDGAGETETTGLQAITFSGSEKGTSGGIKVFAKDLELVNGGDIITSSVNGVAKGGDITVVADNVLLDGQNAFAVTAISAQSVSGTEGSDGGTIRIKAGTLTVARGANITALTNNHGNGGSIILNLGKLVMIGGFNSQLASNITVTTSNRGGSGGLAGKIQVTAGAIEINGFSEINSGTFGPANGGSIDLRAKTITLDGEGASVNAFSRGAFGEGGEGGNITFTAGKIDLRNGGTINATTDVDHKGGDITLNASDVSLRSGSSIDAGTTGTGSGGTITINGGNVLLDGAGASGPTGIFAQTEGVGLRGPGGDVAINGSRLEVTNGATVSTTTLGRGTAGSINVTVDALDVNKSGSIQSSSNPNDQVASRNRGGQGGNITVDAGAVRVASGGLIRTDSQTGGGKGGDIDIHSRQDIDIVDGGEITAAAKTANGGGITLRADRSISLLDSEVSTSAGKNGGNITLKAARLIYLRNSLLSAVAQGNGGNIDIDPQFVIFDRSQVRADAINGNGGNITIRSKVFIPSFNSIISASSQFGVAGNIAIQSPNTNVGASLIQLPNNTLDAESYLPERCVVKQTGQNSSFTVDERRAAPPLPEGPAPSVAVH